MKLKRFNTGKQNSSACFSCADDALKQVKAIFFEDQLDEEEILIELYSPNNAKFTTVAQCKLNIDRVYSKRQITKKCILGQFEFVDSFHYKKKYAVQTILTIKNEQRRLGVKLAGFYILNPVGILTKLRKKEPLVFVGVGNDIFYLLNDFENEQNKGNTHTIKKISSWIQNKTFLKMFFKS